MAAVVIDRVDLEPFATIDPAKADAMIADALATAALIAPCINDVDFAYAAAAKAIIRGAIIRWNEAGTGALTQQQAGPFGQSVDNRPQRKGMFWPSEIEQLQSLCQSDQYSGAYMIDTLGCSTVHADVCSLYFGATYCSCGADLAGFPLWETSL